MCRLPLPRSSDVLERMSWAEIEPLYVELATTRLSKDSLHGWLTQWSRLSDVLEETEMRLWVECVRETSSRAHAERRRRFADEIGARAASFNRQLERQLCASGMRPDGFAVPLRNLHAVASHQEGGASRLRAEERQLGERYQALHANRAVLRAGGRTAVSSLAGALEQAPREERERCWRLLAGRRLGDRKVR